MAQFNYKRITNPTITHADNIMEAIEECVKTIKKFGNSSGSDEMKQLKRLVTQAVMNNARVAANLHSPLGGVPDAQQHHDSKAMYPKKSADPIKR